MVKTLINRIVTAVIAALLVVSYVAGSAAPVYASQGNPAGGPPANTKPEPKPEKDPVDQTCDDLIDATDTGWLEKNSEGDPEGWGDTEVVSAPTGYLIDKYCIKSGSTKKGDGPIIVTVTPPAASVELDYPNINSISHYILHVIPKPQPGVASAAISKVPATCSAGETLVYDVNSWTNATLGANSTATGIEGAASYTVIANASGNNEFTSGDGVISLDKKTLTFSGSLAGKIDSRICNPPVTAEVCESKNSYLVTNENEQGFDYSGTRSDGYYEYVDDALFLSTLDTDLATDPTLYNNKAYGVRAVNIPLKEYGGSFDVDFNVTSGSILPGINVRIDADNDGDVDITLVAEPGVPGYDTFWTNAPGYLPANAGGQGGSFSGDQDDFLALWPNAVVKGEAFSLGSGVATEGTLISWSTPCSTYTYDMVPTTATASVNVVAGDCEMPGKLTYDADSWLKAVVLGGSTASGTTGPAPYTVTAQATGYAQFTTGAGDISDDKKTQTFSGTLDAQETEGCVLGENPEEPVVEIPGTPITPVTPEMPEVLPATSSNTSIVSLVLALTAFIAALALGAHLIRASFSRSL